jgi:hypothetical protein
LLTKARAKVDRYLKAALNPNPDAASHDVCSACGGDSFVPYAEYHSHDE